MHCCCLLCVVSFQFCIPKVYIQCRFNTLILLLTQQKWKLHYVNIVCDLVLTVPKKIIFCIKLSLSLHFDSLIACLTVNPTQVCYSPPIYSELESWEQKHTANICLFFYCCDFKKTSVKREMYFIDPIKRKIKGIHLKTKILSFCSTSSQLDPCDVIYSIEYKRRILLWRKQFIWMQIHYGSKVWGQ